MTEQGNLPTRRVNISTQKMLGGIGSILILLGLVTEIEILLILSIVGFVLWLISIYQLSKKLEKPSIFQKVLIAIILDVAATVLAFVLEELWEGIKPYVSMGDEVVADIKWGVFVGIVATYAIIVVSAYFYKQAFEILASTTAHNLFRVVGLLIFIGVIIIPILYVLALLLMYAGYITIHAVKSLKDVFSLSPLLIGVGFYMMFAVALFTAPNEVEVQGA
jgi:uncharacterized membrane protein